MDDLDQTKQAASRTAPRLIHNSFEMTVIESPRIFTELKQVELGVRVAIRVRCPDCRMAVYVRNGGEMPVTCDHCRKWYGPGRQPVIEVDVGRP